MSYVKRNRAEIKYYACDFETTVYEGQTEMEVLSSALCELYTENAVVHHSIDETMTFFETMCEKYNLIAYYDNLKFDGMFILNWLLKNKRFKESSFTIKDGETEHHIRNDKKSMRQYTYQYSISAKGELYSILIKFKTHKLEIRDKLNL